LVICGTGFTKVPARAPRTRPLKSRWEASKVDGRPQKSEITATDRSQPRHAESRGKRRRAEIKHPWEGGVETAQSVTTNRPSVNRRADLLRAYPTLRAEDLANAWAYHRSHSDEIERQIRDNEAA